MGHYSLSLICVVAFFISACQTEGTVSETAIIRGVSEPYIISRSALLNDCIHYSDDEGGESTGRPDIPKLFPAKEITGTLIELFASAARKAGEKKSHRIIDSSSSADFFYLEGKDSIKLQIGCLVAAKGNAKNPEGMFERDEWKSRGQRKLRGVTGLNTDPEIYFEAETQLSGAGNAFKLVSRRLEYFAEPKSHRNKVDLVFTITFSVPGGTTGSKPFGMASFVFDDVRTGTILNDEELAGYSSEWILIPPVVLEGKEDQSLSPINMHITLNEVADSNRFLLAIADIFDELKKKHAEQ